MFLNILLLFLCYDDVDMDSTNDSCDQLNVARNKVVAKIIPIVALHPYRSVWTIKARVTTKTLLRQFNNARGDVIFFSFDVVDFDSREIKITCFNVVADKFYECIEIGKLFTISKGSLKPA